MEQKKGTYVIRGVLRYQRGNHNPYIEEEQTTQWSKQKLRFELRYFRVKRSLEYTKVAITSMQCKKKSKQPE